MKKNLSLIFILSTALLFSCEYEAQLTYIIKNNSSAPIKVVYTDSKTTTKTDSVNITPSEQATIAVHGQGLSSVKHYKEIKEELRDFTKMDVYTSDTIKSNEDFLKSNRWLYNEINAHSANYILTVENSDF